MIKLIAQMGQSNMVLGFIIFMGLVIGYLGYSSQSSEPLVIIGPPDTDPGSVEMFSGFSIDFSVLENPEYRALEVFGESPVNPDFTGERQDPFEPI